MKKLLKVVSALGVLMLVSGCGGSEASTATVAVTESVAPMQTTTTQVSILPADLGSYTSGIECAKYEQDPSPVRFVSEWGSCTFEDVKVVLYAFPNQQDRDSFLELLLTSGGSMEDIVTHGLVIFVPDSVAKIEPLKQALGM